MRALRARGVADSFPLVQPPGKIPVQKPIYPGKLGNLGKNPMLNSDKRFPGSSLDQRVGKLSCALHGPYRDRALYKLRNRILVKVTVVAMTIMGNRYHKNNLPPAIATLKHSQYKKPANKILTHLAHSSLFIKSPRSRPPF